MKSTILVVLLVVSLFSKNKAYRLSEQSNVVKVCFFFVIDKIITMFKRQ